MISLLLPTPGDPLILDIWYSNFKKYEHLIDECLICINHPITNNKISEETHLNLNLFYESLRSDKVKIFYNHYINDHGLILKFLYERSLGDIIFLMEDDNYILDINVLEEYLNKIKNDEYDILGVSRNSCTTKLVDIFNKRYLRKDISFWPTNFVCKRNLIDKTNLNFSQKIFLNNELIKELNYIPDEICYADTMVYLSLQLHSLTDKIFYIDSSYHSSIDDEKNLKTHNIIDTIGDLHIGSLSSIFYVYLFDVNLNTQYVCDFINLYINDKNTLLEFLRRFIYLKCYLEYVDVNRFYYKIYNKNLNEIINLFDLEYTNCFNLDLLKKLVNKI